MNNNKLNTDKFTKELISKGSIQEPSSDFTKIVMSKILKDPVIKVSFFTKDDSRSNIWLAISISIMPFGFFIFYFLKYGLNFSQVASSINESSLVNAFSDFFLKLWNELSLTPYIFLALIGVLFLVILDKTIVKYLYSI
jgi:hypothetical protein